MNSSLNHIFRTIWSEVLGAWIAVSEITKAKGKRSGSSHIRTIRPTGPDSVSGNKNGGRLKPIVFAVACCFAFNVQANPVGGQVVSGQVGFNATGNTLTVTNTPGAIINWQGFSINANEVTHFAQQSAASAVLNRVVTNNPSVILGTLSSNGQVFLVNPGGIVFGAGSTVDVAGLVATSLNLSDADFLAGRHNFTNQPGAQNISNAGSINAQQGGQVYLIAPNVENTGVITAPNGEILLAAGHEVQLVNSLDPSLRVSITAPAGDATNLGKLIVESGSLGLFGTVVKNTGTASADSATLQGGKVVFKASQRTEITGTVSANGTTGGTIQVLGNEVGIMGGASISANGTNGGGVILVGGDKQGANPDVQNAQVTYVAQTASISADAIQNGNGGKVIVWADDTARIYGSISATGGAEGGNGGFVETSGKRYLDVTSAPNVSAPAGRGGQWLLDPHNVTIQAGPGNMDTIDVLAPYFIPAAADNSTLDVAIVNAALNAQTSIEVNTGGTGIQLGTITVAAPITKTAGVGAGTLILTAANEILINADITASSGQIQFFTGATQVDVNANITLNGGSWDATGGGATVRVDSGAPIINSPLYTGTVNVSAGTATFNGNMFLTNLTLSGGTLTGTGAISIPNTGTFNWTGNSVLAGSGTLTTQAGSTTALTPGFAQTVALRGSRVWDNSGAVTFTPNAGTLSYFEIDDTTADGTAVFNNLAGGQFNINASFNDTHTIGVGTFNNVGTLNKNLNGTAATSGFVPAFNNQLGGIVNVNSGTLRFDTGGTDAGNYVLTNGATLQFHGGPRSISGNIGGTGNVTFSKPLTATAVYTLTGDYNISGTTTAALDSLGTGTLAFNGTVTNLGTGYIQSGGVTNVSFTGMTSGAATGFQNLASIAVNDGSVTFANGTSFSGLTSLTQGGGGTLDFGNNSISVNTLNMTSGTLTGSGNITVTTGGSFNWGGSFNATIAGSGTLTTQSGVMTNITPGFARSALLSGSRVWDNYGTVVFTPDVGTLSYFQIDDTTADGTAVFNNLSGGVFNINASTNDTHTIGVGAFNNAGTLNKNLNGSAATSGFVPAFNNQFGGVVNVNSGTLDVVGALTQSGAINVATGATFTKSGGFINSGTLTGTGTVSVGIGFDLTNASGGIIAPGNGFNNTGTLSITGNLQMQVGSILNIDINGSGAGQFDVLSVTGMAQPGGSTLNLFGVGGVGNYAVLTATGGGINGTTFGTINAGTFTQTPTYAATSFTLAVTANSLAGFVFWDGGASTFNWVDALNWSTDALPTLADNLYIGATAGTVSITTGAQYGNALTCDANLTLSGGSLTLAAPSAINGTLSLTGGTLNAPTNLTVGSYLQTAGTLNAPSTFILQSGSDINFGGVMSSAGGSLTLQAANNINFGVGAGVNSTGALNVILRSDSDANSSGTVTFAGTNTFSLLGGRADLYYNPVSYTDAVTKSDSLTNPYSGVFTATPYTAWMLVNNVTNLQGMNTNLAGNYALGANINAAGTTTWNFNGTTYDGFAPIGNIATPFTGRFNGNAFTIDGLYINRPAASYVGLFGRTNASTIKDVALTNVNITGGSYVGSLVGWHQGTLNNSSNASGTVAGTGISSYVGGLVGLNYNNSTIGTCSAGSTVSGTSYVGGLIGASQQSTLTNVSATGNVTGTNWGAGGLVGSMEGDLSPHSLTNGTASGNVNGSRYVGGLVGWSGYRSTINTGVASGTVTSSLTDAGGLVGLNAYNIVNSHATGSVTGVTNVGGLVGNNQWDNNPSMFYTYGTVSNSYVTTGTVTGTTNVGGLVGSSSSTAFNSIDTNYATSNVFGGTNVGGLVGYFTVNTTVATSYATGNVSGNGANNANLGGLVGQMNGGTVSNSYSTTGTVAGGAGSASVGGLVGWNRGTISNGYASGVAVSGGNMVGGLVGNSEWEINGSYVSTGSVTGVSNYGGLVGALTLSGFLTNSHYNINGVTINGANIVTLGGLYNDNTASFNLVGQYTDWLVNGNKSLSIANYTSPYGSFGFGGTNIYTISNAQGLKDMLGFADNPAYTFTLINPAAITAPAGWYIPYLAADFDGGGKTISNLNINVPNSGMGMFGTTANTATVSNLTVEDATVTGTNAVGAIIGVNYGVLTNSHSIKVTSGLVSGTTDVGGLVGSNFASIANSFGSNVAVNGNTNVGGLVGNNTLGAVITNSYVSSGAVTASVRNIGGLAGQALGTQTNSYFDIDNVTTNGGNNVTVGGLYNTGGAGQFNDWLNVGTPLTSLVIGDYSASLVLQLDGSYGINTLQGMKDMLGFADDPAGYNFSLTGGFSLVPGYYVPKLAGSFNGNNFTISNLSLTLPNSDMGLFGTTSTTSLVSNLNLTNVRVNGYGSVGGLVARNFGNIDTVSVAVNATNGISSVSGSAGGLVGSNNGGSYFTGTGTTYQQIFTGSISNSYVTGGTVSSGNNDVGGLVGYNNQGNIFFSGVTSTAVSGSSNVGGLVGNNQGSTFVGSAGSLRGNITNSYVSGGTVTSTGSSLSNSIGGLAGLNFQGDIGGSYVLNTIVNGGLASMVGGLVGSNSGGFNSIYQGPTLPYLDVYFGIVNNSYVSGGTVSSTGNNVGGLVGNNYGGAIDLSYVDTVNVTGKLNVGGLEGYDSGEGWGGGLGKISNSFAVNTQVTGESRVGGLVGMAAGPLTLGSSDNLDVVINSFVSGGTVTSIATSSASAIGGLVGYNRYSNISNSYVTNGTVVNGGFASDVGGLVGYNIGSSNTIWNGTSSVLAPYSGIVSNSYVNGGTVSGNSNVGGLVGNNAKLGLSDWGFVQSSYVLGTAAAPTTVNGIWGVGGLVGNNAGDVFASYAGGVTVGATSGSATNVGGLVGTNSGTISQSYVNGGTVGAGTATSASLFNVGGLVGSNVGSIDTSYVTGGIVTGSWTVGGLVGTNSGTISQSYVNGGTVNGNSYVGGLIGFNDAIVSNSYVSGSTVSGSGIGGNVGGMVGFNNTVASISNSYVSGGSVASNAATSGYVGGLVGRNWGSITTSYASTGVVNPVPYTFGWGGLAGWNSGGITDSFWDIDVSGTATGIGTGTITGATGIYSSTPTINAFTQATYVGFNFTPSTGVWYMIGGNTRPFLRSEWSATITNAHQLQLIGMDATTLSLSYTLANNIDLAPALAAGGMWNVANGFVPVGDITTPFIGQFDGQNFNISNLKISGAVSQVGLFGVVEVGASISNVGLVNPQVSGSSSVGALVGGNHGAITNTYVNNGTISGILTSGVGGLVGYNYGTINSSYISGGTVSGGSYTAGGLVGRNSISGTISQSYASSGLVTGGTGRTGALVGVNDGGIIDSYWDSTIATGIGMNTGTSNAAGLTTAQMQQQSSFVGFDFINTWRIYNGHTAPLLKSFLKPVTVGASLITGNISKTFDGMPFNPPPLGTLSYSDPTANGLLNEATPFGTAVNVGLYEMFWSGQQGYDISYTAGGMLTITPALVTLMSITANDANKTYGNTLTFSGTEFTPVGLVGGDFISGLTLTSAGAVNTANTGTYSIDVTPGSEVFGQGLASNYNISYLPGVLTVDPATLTYTANTASRMYGSTDPAFSGTVTGFVLGELQANVTTGTETYSTTASTTSNVGSYAINGSGLTANNGNYIFAQAPGNATAYSILQRGISIIATATSKVYGSADPGTYTVGGNGLASWDTNSTVFTGSLSHTGGENVVGSPYAITQGTLAANSNYIVTGFTGNNLTINTALLTVAGVPTNKVLGTPDPALTYTVSGLQFSDTSSTILNGGALVRDPGDTIGSYLVNQGTLDLAVGVTNYTMAYVPCNFTILAPTVVQEITEISLLNTPQENTATTTTEDEKKQAAQAAAEAEVVADAGGAMAEPLPVCQ